MAFVATVPRSTFLASNTASRSVSSSPRRLRRYTVRASDVTETVEPKSAPSTPSGPVVPEDFSAPTPRRFFVRSDRIADIATSSLGTLVRGGTGALIEGYRPSMTGGSFSEASSTLPTTRPKYALRVFEFEACPFCKKVREAICMLDLDAIMFPCPKGSTTYRPYVQQTGGKSQFPYLEDPNTGFASYESGDIIEYLYKTYGPQAAAPPFALTNPVSTVSAGLAATFRWGKGTTRETTVVPAEKPLELYGYEPSPFSKVVREKFVELELAYILRTTPRGSPTREKLSEVTGGTFQVPYLIDHNTGVKMFESADIVDYLEKTYGSGAEGALENPSAGQAFLPAFVQGDDGLAILNEGTQDDSGASLNPKQPTDEVLEEFCKDNEDADECRIYED